MTVERVLFGVYRLLTWNMAHVSMLYQQDVLLGDVSSYDGFQVSKLLQWISWRMT